MELLVFFEITVVGSTGENHVLHGLMSDPYIYNEYNSYTDYTFTLDVNDQVESASVANPDTFSIIFPPSSGPIPVSPFQVSWDRPDNADFFFIDAYWLVGEDDPGKNYFYVTENNAYLISDIPANAEWGQIRIIAINGPSPMRSMEPNLKKLNGYYFSRRYATMSVTFSDNPTKGVPEEPGLLDKGTMEINARVDQFILNKLSEKYPELNQHKRRIIREIQEK